MNLGRQLAVIHITGDEIDTIDNEPGCPSDDTDVDCRHSGRDVDPGRLESVRVHAAVGVGDVLRP